MGDCEEVTLEGQAVEEILKEARRSKELAREFGAYGWKKPDALPNKRFLNNTLVSTLRHGYRQEKKNKDGSYKKYQEHISKRRGRGRGSYPHQGEKKELIEETNFNEPEPDYGEFDAIAYSDMCTDLYIRDSHRKHFFMRGNFVEKRYKNSSSESEESYTEYDETSAGRWKHDRFIDTGSADEYADKKSEKSSHRRRKEKTSNQQTPSPIKKCRREGAEYFPGDRTVKTSREVGTSRDYDEYESNGSSDSGAVENEQEKSHEENSSDSEENDSDREPTNSGTESADNMERGKGERGKGKKTRKLPNDGKALWEKISSRSMYADIEEMKMHQNDFQVAKRSRDRDVDFNGNPDKSHLEKLRKEHEERKEQEYFRKKEEYLRRKQEQNEREEEYLKRLAYRKHKEEERQREKEIEEEVMRRLAEKEWKEKQMRRAAPESFRGHPPRRPFRGRPFFRGRPPFRGRMPRGFSGFPMFPPVNPFYASMLYEMDPYLLEQFIKEHGHRLLRKMKRHNSRSTSSSRSHSRSRSRSGRSRHKKRHYSPDRDRSYSRSRGRSYSRRSRNKSRSRSRRYSSYSRSRSRSHRSRSYSRRRSSSRSKSRSRSYRNRSYSDYSRSRSRSSDKSRSRRRSYSDDSRTRQRSPSEETRKHSDSDDSRSRSHRNKKRKKSKKHKKSKHRRQSHKKRHQSKKSSDSEQEEDGDVEGEQDLEIKNEDQSEGEIVSDDGLENVSDEEDGGGWSSSIAEDWD